MTEREVWDVSVLSCETDKFERLVNRRLLIRSVILEY